MNRYKYIVLVLVGLWINSSYSQEFTIKLSIEWDSIPFYGPDSIPMPKWGPYLKVDYINNTGEDVYLPRIVEPDPWEFAPRINCDDFIPIIACYYLLGLPYDGDGMYIPWLKKKAKERNSTKDTSYHDVIIAHRGFLSILPWEDYTLILTDDGECEEGGDDKDRLNCFMYDFYRYYIGNRLGVKWRNIARYKENECSDIVEANEEIRPYIFLNKGDTCTERYNLIGFYLSRGTYNFVIDKSTYGGVSDFEGYHDVLDAWSGLNSLPKEIDGYKLFEGKYNLIGVMCSF